MPDFTIWGVNVIETSFRWLHAGMVAGWLLFDFLVYWLHFDVKNPAVPLEARLERAKIMHGIDRIVAYIFILTLPVGIILCYYTDNAPFSSAWLTWKHFLYAVVIIDGLETEPLPEPPQELWRQADLRHQDEHLQRLLPLHRRRKRAYRLLQEACRIGRKQ